MKNIIKHSTLFLFLSLFIISFISCNNKDAEEYFSEALEIIDEHFFSSSFPAEDFDKAIRLLDKSINKDKTLWKAYRQKYQLYKVRGNYDKMAEVYQQWLDNGNSLPLFDYFSYGCTIYAAGNKDKAMGIFSEIYKANKEKFKDQKYDEKEEAQLVAVVLSGIITKNITYIPPLDDYIVPGDPEATVEAFNALSSEDKLQILFNYFISNYNKNPDEMITCYAGS